MKTKQHILIIDDEPEILALLTVLLKAKGYEVSTSICGRSALEYLETQNFDAVICDYIYMMPQMDGIKILKEVRAKKNYVPFIFFSGNTQEKQGMEMKNLGAYEIVEKPQLELLIDALAKIISHNEKVKILNPKGNEVDEFAELVFSSVG